MRSLYAIGLCGAISIGLGLGQSGSGLGQSGSDSNGEIGAPLPAWTSRTLDIHQIATGRGNSALIITGRDYTAGGRWRGGRWHSGNGPTSGRVAAAGLVDCTLSSAALAKRRGESRLCANHSFSCRSHGSTASLIASCRRRHIQADRHHRGRRCNSDPQNARPGVARLFVLSANR
jgi:hypothetical protein